MTFVSYISFLIFHNNHFIRRIYRVAEFFYNPDCKLLVYKKDIIGTAIFGWNLKTINTRILISLYNGTKLTLYL